MSGVYNFEKPSSSFYGKDLFIFYETKIEVAKVLSISLKLIVFKYRFFYHFDVDKNISDFELLTFRLRIFMRFTEKKSLTFINDQID